MKTIFAYLLLVSLGFSSAYAQQENCGNGIDDDGNGLIDCADPACTGGAVPLGSQFNTATNGSGGRLPGGTTDHNWRIATQLAGPYNAATVMTSIPPNYYSSPWVDCNWISHSNNGSHSVNMDYYYRIQFLLPCENACGESYADENVFCLSMDFFADNSVYEIYVNGIPQSSSINGVPVSNPLTHVGFNATGRLSTTLCRNWRAGLNELIVHIKSGPGYAGFLAQYSINAPPEPGDPTITVPASAVNGLCENEGPVTYTAASPGGTWSADCGTCINSSTGVFNPAAAGVGDYEIIYKHTGACATSDTVSVSVYATQYPTIDPVSDLCITSAPYQLSASDAGGTWNGSGITDPAGGLFDPALAGAGTHSITYTLPNPCATPAQVNVTVYDIPSLNITPAGPFCENSPATTLTATHTGGTWSGPGITDTTNGLFDPTVAGAGTHSITYTLPNPCATPAQSSITVYGVSSVNITAAGPFCVTENPVVLSANLPGGTWSGQGITDQAGGLFDPASAGAGTHAITYTLPNPCAAPAQISITVHGIPSLNITPAGPFCLTESPVMLSANLPGGTWNGPGITDTLNGIFSPENAGVGTHTITYWLLGYCDTYTTLEITVYPPPEARFSTDTASGCVPLAVHFNPDSPFPGTYNWSINGVPVSSSDTGFVYLFTQPGCYDVAMEINAGGCQAYYLAQNSVCVGNAPVAAFDFSPEITNVSQTAIQFINQSSYAVSSFWTFGNTDTLWQMNPVYKFRDTEPGRYEVCLFVTSAEGCTDWVCQEVIIHDDLLVYVPNSFTPDGDGINDIFIPVVNGYDFSDFEFSIFNRWGELIFTSKSAQKGWDGTHKGIASMQGVYVWKLRVKDIVSQNPKEFIGHVNLIR